MSIPRCCLAREYTCVSPGLQDLHESSSYIDSVSIRRCVRRLFQPNMIVFQAKSKRLKIRTFSIQEPKRKENAIRRFWWIAVIPQEVA